MTRSQPVTDDTVAPEAIAAHIERLRVLGRLIHNRVLPEILGHQIADVVNDIPMLSAFAVTQSELDVERLARALFAVHPLMYPQSWPDDDDIGPDPTEDATAIAAEYARLASENRSA
jgi:hypothetical protein